jgi:hypothetical protein
MTKNIHTATLPDGTVAKRTSTSGRVYLFCVASRPSYDFALKRASKLSETDADNYAYHLQVIAEGGRTYETQWRDESNEDFAVRCAKRADDALASNEGATSAAEYQAIKRDQRVAAVEANKAAGHYETWGVTGWQSRADLAQKELAKVAANVWLGVAEAKIIPVTMVTK